MLAVVVPLQQDRQKGWQRAQLEIKIDLKECEEAFRNPAVETEMRRVKLEKGTKGNWMTNIALEQQTVETRTEDEVDLTAQSHMQIRATCKLQRTIAKDSGTTRELKRARFQNPGSLFKRTRISERGKVLVKNTPCLSLTAENMLNESEPVWQELRQVANDC